MTDLAQYSREMAERGLRRLALFSGPGDACLPQVVHWQQTLPGDWLWVGDDASIVRHCPPATIPAVRHCLPSAIRTVLGQEFLHAVFDARQGFHAEAFAALAGTLRAGSWLLLLTPPLADWPELPDNDALRWSEQPQPIATPHFTQRLRTLLQADPQVLLMQPGQPPRWPDNASFPLWQPNVQAQQALCQQLLDSAPGVSVLTAPRGRGKSALAGMLAQRWPGRCWVTAPAKAPTGVLAQFAGAAYEFIAPDRLLAEYGTGAPADVDWLLIDEAAAIPTPQLTQLIALFPRVLLTTTIQGYEGTGRGFVLKFCATLPEAQLYQLQPPLRWAENDPLEQWVARALLFDEPQPVAASGSLAWRNLQSNDWLTSSALLSDLYRLLCSAHYRTSPLDLRRMMDAPGQHFSVVTQQQQLQGGIWLLEEGGLDARLAGQVWAGTRRPPGNLVAQSLAAHAGLLAAAGLRARRISRIAVAPALRRQDVGRQLVEQAAAAAVDCDYLSVSFGYTPELAAFWQACGFTLVRLGSQREASSGCYAAMALRPCSAAGEALLLQAQQRFSRELGWLLEVVDIPQLQPAAREERAPDEQDWLELAGFAWAQRPYIASRAALGRLLLHCPADLPLLSAAVLLRRPVAAICQQFGLSGQRQLLARWREEAARGLYSLERSTAEKLQRQVMSLQ